MSAERAGLAEAFAADFAHERSGSGVDRHVAGEVIVSVKYLRKHTRGPCGVSVLRVQSQPGEGTTYLPQPKTPFGNQSPFHFAKSFPTH